MRNIFEINPDPEKYNNGHDELTPWLEFREDFKETKWMFLGITVTAFLLSSLLTGYIYFLVATAFSDETIYLFNCFLVGCTKMIWLTLIFVFLVDFFAYRIYRALKKSYKKNYKDSYLSSNNTTFGGAHFQTDAELEENFNIYDSINDCDGYVLGTTYEDEPLEFIFPPGSNRNFVYFGSAGSGKSASVVLTFIYQAMKRMDSMIITDSKGAIYTETVSVARELGYTIRVLNLKPSEFKNSDGFNIIETLSPDDPQIVSKAEIIANIIMGKSENEKVKSNDFWADNEFNLFKCLILYVATDPGKLREGKNNLKGVREMLTQQNAVKQLANTFDSVSDEIIRGCYHQFASTEERNQGNIINGAATKLQKIDDIYLSQVLSHNEIDFVLPLKKPCIYYVIMSDQDTSYRFLSTMFFSMAFKNQCEYSDKLTQEQKKDQKEVLYLLDEYANTGGIIGLDTTISTVRSRKLAMVIILQNKQQLDAMYGEEKAQTILGNCYVQGMLGVNDTATSEFFSKRLGNTTVVVESEKYNESVMNLTHAHAEKQLSYSENSRPLWYPEDFSNGRMKSSEVIYAISGQPPVKCKKYFSELSGEMIHPLGKRNQELGKKMAHLHKPRWRKIKEDQIKQNQKMMEALRNKEAVEKEQAEKAEQESKNEPAASKEKTTQKDSSKTKNTNAAKINRRPDSDFSFDEVAEVKEEPGKKTITPVDVTGNKLTT